MGFLAVMGPNDTTFFFFPLYITTCQSGLIVGKEMEIPSKVDLNHVAPSPYALAPRDELGDGGGL